MAITVEWDDDDHTIVRMASQEAWDLKELQAASYQAMALIRNVTHRVYVVSDLNLSFSLPPGILWQLRDLNRVRPSNWSGGIAIAQDSFAVTLVATLSQIYMERQKNRLFVARSNAEAYQIIERLKQIDQANGDD